MRPLAEFEVWHSRPIAPTRRVALGDSRLPFDGRPGFGGLLLGGVVAGYINLLGEEMIADVHELLDDILQGGTIAQPRLRHRFQTDRIGLSPSTHRLLPDGETVAFELAHRAPPAPQVLAACYAASRLAYPLRGEIVGLLRMAANWSGEIGPSLTRYLSGRHSSTRVTAASVSDPHGWARATLGLDVDDPSRRDVQRRFRELIVSVHPDRGGDGEEAAERIDELTQARRILLRSAAG